MSDQLVEERQGLEKKDKAELQAIVSALGGTTTARMRKAELVEQILELSGATARAASDGPKGEEGDGDDKAGGGDTTTGSSPSSDEEASSNGSDSSTKVSGGIDSKSDGGRSGSPRGRNDGNRNDQNRGSGNRNGGGSKDSDVDADHPIGPDGEPLADWEIQVLEETGGDNRGGGRSKTGRAGRNQPRGRERERNDNSQNQNKSDSNQSATNNPNAVNKPDDGDDVDDGNRRARRGRSRGRGRDRSDAGSDGVSTEPVEVQGYLDLRDEGYAFLRVNGLLPSRDDASVSV